VATEAYYDKRSSTYNSTFDFLYYRVYDAITWKYLEPYVPSDPNALILDAGGGTGRWAIRMAKKGPKVFLIDISEGMLRVADKRVKEERLNHRITTKKCDITKTDFAEETFDMILCEHALFLFKEPDAPLKEFNRILKKKARLIVSLHNRYVQTLACISENPNADNLQNALKILLREKYSYMTKDDKVKIYTWTPNEFQNILKRNGFYIEKIIGKGMTMPLRISKDVFMKKEYSESLFNSILQLELALCDKPDALVLAGHLQAIVYKT
jgi:ubiquinone/menaquinone biosynthesis C-methylase UbiE